MITKQSFIRAASIVSNIRQGQWSFPETTICQDEYVDVATVVAEAFATLFRDDNPRFDQQRFLIACGLMDTPAKGKR